MIKKKLRKCFRATFTESMIVIMLNKASSFKAVNALLRVFFLVVKCLPKSSTERMKMQSIKLLRVTGRGRGRLIFRRPSTR